jgi:hypothetical protein
LPLRQSCPEGSGFIHKEEVEASLTRQGHCLQGEDLIYKATALSTRWGCPEGGVIHKAGTLSQGWKCQP